MDYISVRGVNIFPFSSPDQLIEYVDRRKGILVAINAEKILHANDMTRGIINRNIGYCDGAGAMLALRRKGHANACKIAGCDLWLKIVCAFYKSKSFYLVGGRQNVIDDTVRKLQQDFKGINIVGAHNGYFDSDNEMRQVIDDIAAKRPDVVFVAMGSPKQELFMEQMQQSHSQAIYQGLGGSFDVYTGHVARAPQWWIDHNLEFAYRLIRQPSRIKRQIQLLKYAWWLVSGKI